MFPVTLDSRPFFQQVTLGHPPVPSHAVTSTWNASSPPRRISPAPACPLVFPELPPRSHRQNRGLSSFRSWPPAPRLRFGLLALVLSGHVTMAIPLDSAGWEGVCWGSGDLLPFPLCREILKGLQQEWSPGSRMQSAGNPSGCLHVNHRPQRSWGLNQMFCPFPPTCP